MMMTETSHRPEVISMTDPSCRPGCSYLKSHGWDLTYCTARTLRLTDEYHEPKPVLLKGHAVYEIVVPRLTTCRAPMLLS